MCSYSRKLTEKVKNLGFWEVWAIDFWWAGASIDQLFFCTVGAESDLWTANSVNQIIWWGECRQSYIVVIVNCFNSLFVDVTYGSSSVFLMRLYWIKIHRAVIWNTQLRMWVCAKSGADVGDDCVRVWLMVQYRCIAYYIHTSSLAPRVLGYSKAGFCCSMLVSLVISLTIVRST